MLGQLDPTKKKCIVIGAGINGLFTAYFLKKKGFDVTVYEAGTKTGGLIDTEMTPMGMCQHGPHLTRSTPAFMQICSDLNVELEQAKVTKRYFFKDNKRVKFPVSFGQIIKAMWNAKYRIRKNEYLHAKDFFDYHTTPKVAQNILNPMSLGIYGANLNQLDPEIAFPKFFPTERTSLVNHYKRAVVGQPKSKVIAPLLGFKELVNALSKYLKDEIVLNSKLDNLNHLDVSQSNVIITTPSYVTSQLLADIDSRLSQDLEEVDYSGLQVSTISFSVPQPNKIPKGIGVLSSQKKSPVLGSLFSSTTFSNRSNRADAEMFTVMSVIGTQKDWIENTLSQIVAQPITVHSHVLNTYKRAIPLYDSQLKKVLYSHYDWFNSSGNMIFGNYTGTASLSQSCQDISDYLEKL